MTLSGTEVLQVTGVTNGRPSSETFTTTTQSIANLASGGGLGYNSGTHGATSIFNNANPSVESLKFYNNSGGDFLAIGNGTTSVSLSAVNNSGSGNIDLDLYSQNGGAINLNTDTLTTSGNIEFSNSVILQGDSGAGGTITFPSATDSVVYLALAQTLTSKTLTSPVINNILGSSGNAVATFIDGASDITGLSITTGTTTVTLGVNTVNSAGSIALNPKGTNGEIYLGQGNNSSGVVYVEMAQMILVAQNGTLTTINIPTSGNALTVNYPAGRATHTYNYAIYETGFTITLNGATPVTVTNASITVNSVVIFTLKTVGGTVGAYPAIQTISSGTGFTVAGTALDTSTYNYIIID